MQPGTRLNKFAVTNLLINILFQTLSSDFLGIK